MSFVCVCVCVRTLLFLLAQNIIVNPDKRLIGVPCQIYVSNISFSFSFAFGLIYFVRSMCVYVCVYMCIYIMCIAQSIVCVFVSISLFVAFDFVDFLHTDFWMLSDLLIQRRRKKHPKIRCPIDHRIDINLSCTIKLDTNIFAQNEIFNAINVIMRQNEYIDFFWGFGFLSKWLKINKIKIGP